MKIQSNANTVLLKYLPILVGFAFKFLVTFLKMTHTFHDQYPCQKRVICVRVLIQDIDGIIPYPVQNLVIICTYGMLDYFQLIQFLCLFTCGKLVRGCKKHFVVSENGKVMAK